ncbi:hypothetical protein ACFC26_34815 [Kitasatospora purpeofusca]|uniref:hypothetical protein n=1 Tax=Kitasatospora purpeofusca TaxID=67352 RepID=UPI0035DDE459
MNTTEPALLVGLLGPPGHPEHLLVRLADGRQDVTARLDEADAHAVAAACRLRAEHSASSVTHWLQDALPVRVTRRFHGATNTGPLTFAGFDT